MEIELWFRMKIKVKGNQHNFIKWIIFDIMENVFISAVVFADDTRDGRKENLLKNLCHVY